MPRSLTKKLTVAWFVIAVLALFVAVSALPRYASSWPWSTPLKVPNQSALQAIREEGITLPGWQTDEQIKTKIGGDTWSIQQLSLEESSASETASETAGEAASESAGESAGEATDSTAKLAADPYTIFLLLRPQVWEADQPEVEWLDVEGSQRWQTDSRQRLSIAIAANPKSGPSAGSRLKDAPHNSETIRIKTDFFRAWSQDQTYAIVQWYASPIGGSASPAWWFWADQQAQWSQRQRLPWVAVSLWLPIEPLGDIVRHRDRAIALSRAVQSELLRTVFPEIIATSLEDQAISLAE
ncbi:MAG: cyanoexosortase B system-associated protein [Cyanobacteria bacterium J06560_2]